MRNRMFLVGLLIALLISGSAFADQNMSAELHGFFIGGSLALNNDGAAMTLKDNFSPQVSAVVQLGSTGSTYYLPGLTWKTNTGWLQVDALSIFTEVAKMPWGSFFFGGAASPLSFSTEGSVKREDVGVGGLDLGVVVPLNKKAEKLYLAVALKYNVTVDYDPAPDKDRIGNAIVLTMGLIGLNPFE